MQTTLKLVRRSALSLLLMASSSGPILAQEVSIPDSGLNAAIRDALQKPFGPLTEQDLLSLTNLDSSRRNVQSIEGLQTARNLVSLDLQLNHLTNFSLPAELAKLSTLDVSINPLASFSLPSGLTNLATLILESGGFSDLTLPGDLTQLSCLDLSGNQLTRFDALSNLRGLVFVDLSFNSFTNFSLTSGLTNLAVLRVSGNLLTNVTLPEDLAALTNLSLDQNQLTDFTLPPGLTNLIELDLGFNQLTNLTLPADLWNLNNLELNNDQLSAPSFPSNLTGLHTVFLRDNQITNFNLPSELSALVHLDLSKNPLRDITLPAGLNQLSTLRLSENQLTRFILPAGLTNLTALSLSENQLTNVVLPPDLGHLDTLNLDGNQLTSFTVPAGLTNLTGLFLTGNQLTNITLPPDMTQVTAFGYLGNPLETLVLSETQAANLAADVTFLQNQGVPVYTYPLTIQLLRPRPLTGAFQLGITGPPGVYAVLASSDLADWSQAGIVSNALGSVSFVDVTAQLYPRRFYRALPLSPPTNMVFIPPNTFTMGSPPNEQDRAGDEGPQTTVTLTRGFWIGKFEVTQGEYLSVMNTNPSFFPGDLSQPISSVSWFDATNYCWILTQRELAAGRIPVGSHFRLPTEAEWECAARAGTTTRFSYGDDPGYAGLTNHAWLFWNAGLAVHPVGQKLPNPWGLYDMTGNVWEWCQDWYGDLPGGAVTNPTGPPSNPIGLKVMRGGAYDYFENDCRSARRLFFPASSFFTDTDLGFRVVLVVEPH